MIQFVWLLSRCLRLHPVQRRRQPGLPHSIWSAAQFAINGFHVTIVRAVPVPLALTIISTHLLWGERDQPHAPWDGQDLGLPRRDFLEGVREGCFVLFVHFYDFGDELCWKSTRRHLPTTVDNVRFANLSVHRRTAIGFEYA